MKFTLAYNLENHGWANSTLQCHGESYEIDSISYLSDAFTELSQAVFHLLNGVSESDCGFDHEPGRTKLRFVSTDGIVQIDVYEFENELRNEPWSNGKCVKSFKTSLMRLKSQYLEEADRILEKFGPEEYEKRWGYPFPMDTYKRIKQSKLSGSHDA